VVFVPLPHNSAISKTIQGRGRHPKHKLPAPETDARLRRVVHVLMGYPTVVISGTKLAQEIKTTRSEVWRLVQSLRRLGVEIEGHPSSGYQLTSVPDLLLPEILDPLLRGTIFGGNIHHYYRAGSTNTLALEAAVAGAPEGSTFLAEQQTAGRGRGSNQWHSPESVGIYCSIILRPSLPPSDVLVLTLAAGLAVQSAIQEVDHRVLPDLKWPNDVLLTGKKVCGILTEMVSEATRVRHIVVGIGINVNHAEFPPELEPIATSLRIMTGTEWSRIELCAALLKSLDREYKNLLRGPDARADILRRFEEHSSSVRGREIWIEESPQLRGTSEGLDDRGFLRIRTREGVKPIYSGTVRFK
jgi:BirA family transcriptional regulator, biotin operon repressor / biotin---[acetyl-CoA-carboxylase] ligase